MCVDIFLHNAHITCYLGALGGWAINVLIEIYEYVQIFVAALLNSATPCCLVRKIIMSRFGGFRHVYEQETPGFSSISNTMRFKK